MKSALRRASAAALMLFSIAAAAQTYPAKPIRLIVPYAQSSSPDLVSRLVAQKMAEATGQAVVVDNKAGASGMIGADLLSKAPADGYTIGVIDGNTYGILPAANPNLTYDPLRDFALITQAVRLSLFLVVNASLEASSVREFIALAKARPGMNYGSAGTRGVHHLAMEQFIQMSGIRLTHIPYKGVVQTVPALITGEVSAMFNSLPSVAPHVKAGKLRVLAAGSPQRSPLMPEVPTVAESGLPGFEALYNMGFAAPAGTPRELIEVLRTQVGKALQQPDVNEKLNAVGLEVVLSTPAEFREQIRREQAYYAKLVGATQLKSQ